MTTPFLRGRRAKDSPIFELRTSARSHRQSFALRRKRLGEELNEVELTFKECAALQEATVEPTIRVELVQGTKKGKAGSLFSHSHAMTLLPLASQSDLLSASLGGLRCEGTQSLPRTTTLCIVAFPFRLLPSLLRWQSYLLRRSCGAKQKDWFFAQRICARSKLGEPAESNPDSSLSRGIIKINSGIFLKMLDCNHIKEWNKLFSQKVYKTQKKWDGWDGFRWRLIFQRPHVPDMSQTCPRPVPDLSHMSRIRRLSIPVKLFDVPSTIKLSKVAVPSFGWAPSLIATLHQLQSQIYCQRSRLHNSLLRLAQLRCARLLSLCYCFAIATGARRQRLLCWAKRSPPQNSWNQFIKFFKNGSMVILARNEQVFL